MCRLTYKITVLKSYLEPALLRVELLNPVILSKLGHHCNPEGLLLSAQLSLTLRLEGQQRGICRHHLLKGKVTTQKVRSPCHHGISIIYLLDATQGFNAPDRSVNACLAAATAASRMAALHSKMKKSNHSVDSTMWLPGMAPERGLMMKAALCGAARSLGAPA